MYETIPITFYQQDNVVEISRKLLGKYLMHQTTEGLTGGKIVETEAYSGKNDRACHAHGKRTPRTEVMYQSGGRAYIYLCYGIHHLFNIVTNKEGMADAVLIRAIEPVEGLDLMQERTGKSTRIASGPGLVGKAMELNRLQSGQMLNTSIWLENRNEKDFTIFETTRIGVDYAGDDAKRPWRFYIRDNPYVSRK